jgi:hypothetical protein
MTRDEVIKAVKDMSKEEFISACIMKFSGELIKPMATLVKSSDGNCHYCLDIPSYWSVDFKELIGARATELIMSIAGTDGEFERIMRCVANISFMRGVALEWMRDDRILTFLVKKSKYIFVRSQGVYKMQNLQDGLIESPDHAKELWAWLEGG